MVADHVGFLFFPELIIFRLIGRLSFPIFAFLISEGYKYTRDFKKYLWRIFLFFVISEPIYLYAFNPPNFEILNIFFVLFLSLIAIYLYDKIDNKKYGLFVVFLISALGILIGADYNFFGILLIFSFHLYNIKTEFKKLLFVQLILIILLIIYINFLYLSNNLILPICWLLSQFIYLIPLFLIRYYNGQRGKNIKYFFYIFYPLHILILGLIAHLIQF